MAAQEPSLASLSRESRAPRPAPRPGANQGAADLPEDEVGPVETEQHRRHVGLLGVTGQELHGHQEGQEGHPAEAAPGEGQVLHQQGGGEPGGGVELVEVPHLGAHEPAEAVEGPGDGGGEGVLPQQVAGQERGEEGRQEEVHHHRPVHGLGGGTDEEDQVQGVEDGALEVGQEGGAVVDVGVPEGDAPLAEGRRREVAVGEHVGHRVVADDHQAPEDQLPAEEEGGQGQHEGAGDEPQAPAPGGTGRGGAGPQPARGGGGRSGASGGAERQSEGRTEGGGPDGWRRSPGARYTLPDGARRASVTSAASPPGPLAALLPGRRPARRPAAPPPWPPPPGTPAGVHRTSGTPGTTARGRAGWPPPLRASTCGCS